ncbi:unnamed protein product, partial [marine sediment metagenome]
IINNNALNIGPNPISYNLYIKQSTDEVYVKLSYQ